MNATMPAGSHTNTGPHCGMPATKESAPTAAEHRGKRKPRLLVLATHPSQHHAPLYRCLAQRGHLNLQVLYLSDAGATAHMDPAFGRTVQWDIPLLEGYSFQVLQPGSDITTRRFWARHDRRLSAALAQADPDCLLVYGYASRMNWVASAWARRHGVRLVYASDSNSRCPQRLITLKRPVLRQYFRRIDAFLAPSERNVEYLCRYGAPAARIQRWPFAVELERFSAAATTSDAARPYDFICAGKLTPKKRVSHFLDALDILARASERPIAACLVGDGPCREQLLAQARTLPDHCTLDYLGFVNQRSMPATLQSARTLVFPSELEAYGLAAAEAAASGLALVLEENIGCIGATVLAQPDVNALVYPHGDVAALARAMERTLDDDALRQRMQQASVAITRQHDVHCAAAVIENLIGEGRHDV